MFRRTIWIHTNHICKCVKEEDDEQEAEKRDPVCFECIHREMGMGLGMRANDMEKKRSETTTKNHFCEVSRIIVALNVNYDYTPAMHALSSSTSTSSSLSWWFAAEFRTQITYQILYFYLRIFSQAGRQAGFLLLLVIERTIKTINERLTEICLYANMKMFAPE